MKQRSALAALKAISETAKSAKPSLKTERIKTNPNAELDAREERKP
jgi:hypothetical protein